MISLSLNISRLISTSKHDFHLRKWHWIYSTSINDCQLKKMLRNWFLPQNMIFTSEHVFQFSSTPTHDIHLKTWFEFRKMSINWLFPQNMIFTSENVTFLIFTLKHDFYLRICHLITFHLKKCFSSWKISIDIHRKVCFSLQKMIYNRLSSLNKISISENSTYSIFTSKHNFPPQKMSFKLFPPQNMIFT